jgi:hypothetical protein
MKNITCISFLVFFFSQISYAQERLFFLGYTKNYISSDSTNFTLNFDLNRIPGATEKVGGTFIYNDVLKESQWRLYIKPSADINIGSGTTTAANNINVGLPIGFSYDGIKLSELSFEGSPEFVADKSFDNFLFYGSVGAYFKVESKRKTLLNISTGLTLSNGKRTYSDKGKNTNSYGRFTIPLYVKFAFKNAKEQKDTTKTYYRFQFSNTIKINNVYKDNATITPDPSLFYTNGKFEFYFTPRLAFAIGYTYGYEEPLFKKVNSLSFGLTFARF